MRRECVRVDIKRFYYTCVSASFHSIEMWIKRSNTRKRKKNYSGQSYILIHMFFLFVLSPIRSRRDSYVKTTAEYHGNTITKTIQCGFKHSPYYELNTLPPCLCACHSFWTEFTVLLLIPKLFNCTDRHIHQKSDSIFEL